MEAAADFARVHPASWVAEFRAKVQAEAPDGYHARLLGLLETLLSLLA